MTNYAIEELKSETGLIAVEKKGKFYFSIKQIYNLLYEKTLTTKKVKVYKYFDWLKKNILIKDEEDNMVYTSLIKTQIKTKGRPLNDYIISKIEAKMVLARSRTKLGFKLLRYLVEFEENAMELFQKRIKTKASFIFMSERINDKHEEIKPYHFSNEVNMIYRIVFGVTAKQ